jgi:chromosome segregation ATPase
MARPARSDEEIDQLVWPAANAEQERNGAPPTNRAVAAAIRAQGHPISTEHVLNSLARWAQHQPQPLTVPREALPASLQQMLAGWLEEDRQKQRSELEARLAELTATNEDLAREALESEAQIATLQGQLAERVREHDTLAGHLAELTTGRDKIAADLQRERESLEQVRTQLVTADLRLRELETLRTNHEKLRGDFRAERDARIAAERVLAGEQATNTALNKQVTDLESREKGAVTEARDLKKQLTDLTGHLQQVESQRAQAVGQASAAQAALKQLMAELDHQRQDLVRAQAEKADAVRGAGIAEGARAGAKGRIEDLERALSQCQTKSEQLARENSTLAEQVRTLSPKKA